MENIFILPTSKPSRLGYYTDPKDTQLYILSNGNKIGDYKPNWKPQNIYITSGEEIKEGNWVLDIYDQRWKLQDNKLVGFDNSGIKRFSTDNVIGHQCKKIILTTDQDLIKDGVQAINDDFLEWIVKNPTCKEIEVVRKGISDHMKRLAYYIYTIIIPIEESKYVYGKKFSKKELEEFKKWQAEMIKNEEEQLGIPMGKLNMVIGRNKPETLEEATKNWITKNSGIKSLLTPDFVRESFIAGAKWQQEKSYREDMRKSFEAGYDRNTLESLEIPDSEQNYRNFDEWFEKFKKK